MKVLGAGCYAVYYSSMSIKPDSISALDEVS